MKVVICGGGIMGVTTAYFLALRGTGAVIIEEKGLASGASGNAGGFLARNWCDHQEIGPLARQSFDLHMNFADSLHGCDYRRLDTLEVNVSDAPSSRKSKRLPEWIDGSVSSSSSLGSKETTAQVHPRKLCEAVLAAAQERAVVTLRIAKIYGFQRTNDRVIGVKVRLPNGEEEIIEAGDVVITMGPWSGEALKWLGFPQAVSGRRAHGIVLKAPADQAENVSGHALFLENQSTATSAEVYPRPDGTIYMCGMSDSKPLPTSIKDVEVDDEIVAEIKRLGDKASSAISAATIERRQSCYMPMSADQVPLIGKIPNISNVYIAAGHSCWGILNGPATGKVMSDLISDGKCEWLDITNYDPARLLS